MCHQMDNGRNGSKIIGQSDLEYEMKVAWLKQKWPADPRKDSVPARVIRPLLYLSAAPIYQAAIANNLSYFEKNYKPEQVNSNELLAVACLSGSEQVANFLLEKLKLNYLSPECSFMLGYVSASQNTEWTKNIAQTLAKSGKEMPLAVANLAEYSTYEIIRDIFKPKNVNFTKK